MKKTAMLLLGAALAAPVGSVRGQVEAVDSLEARVWLDRGEEPVVQRGEEVRVYYRTSLDAYAAIFRIDTDGVISLVFPQHPDMDHSVRGGRDYRLLFPNSARWTVDEDPGAGYYFMVASPEPLDFSLLGWDDERGWDLGEVGATVYEDPYVAIDDYVAAVVPNWEIVPYALDFLTYNVGSTHEYPRFLCYDCHERRSYSSWNPYAYQCSTFRVVIWDDPYFYPRYRYVGTRVVFARPFAPRPRYGFVTRVAGGPRTPLVRTRAAPPRRTVEYKESAARPIAQPRNPARPGTSPAPSSRVRPGALPSRTPPPTRSGATSGTAPRTGSPGSARVTPRAGAGAPSSGSGATTARPTLRRRPAAPSDRLPARVPRAGRTSSVPGTTTRGTTTRGTTSRGTTSRGSAVGAPTRRPAVAPRAAPSRGSVTPPRSGRVAPRGGAAARRPVVRPPTRSAPRAAPSRPSAGSRAPAARRPTAGSSARRPPPRQSAPPRRRPGGRGG